jgi:hypothetical protein
MEPPSIRRYPNPTNGVLCALGTGTPFWRWGAMSEHDQTWVKVNAPVDSGIVRVVEALSLFPELETVESCEADRVNESWICFRYGQYWDNGWRELADFVFDFLAPQLFERVGDSVSIVLRPRESGVALADLSIRPESKREVELALRELAAKFNDDRCRNSACCDGKSGTSRGRC